MARPRIEREEKRLFRIVVRLNEKEWLKIEKAAKECGIPAYLAIRKKLLTGHFPEAKTGKIDQGIYVELKKIGVNVNQLAWHANVGNLPPGLKPILTELNRQQEQIIKLLLG